MNPDRTTVYYLPGYGGRVHTGLGQALLSRGVDLAGRETVGDFRGMRFMDVPERRGGVRGDGCCGGGRRGGPGARSASASLGSIPSRSDVLRFALEAYLGITLAESEADRRTTTGPEKRRGVQAPELVANKSGK